VTRDRRDGDPHRSERLPGRPLPRRIVTAAPALLALDVGTSRCRAAVLTPSGDVLAEASRPTPVETGAGGAAVVDVDRIWSDVAALARTTTAGIDVAAIGVAAQLGTVFLDDRREPLLPAMLWADRRAAGEAEELAGTAGAASLDLARRPIAAELHGPRLRWLRRHRPSAATAVRGIVSLKDAIVLRLTGALVTDETHASYSGLFDVAGRRWSPELCRLNDVPMALLPEARPAVAPAGRLTEAAAGALALRPGLPVSVGGSDGTLGTLGGGAVRAGVTVDVAGTTDVLLHIAAHPGAPGGGAIANAHAVPGLWSIGGPTGMTGGAVSWIAGMLGHPTVGEALAALPDAIGTAAAPSVGPPYFYPALSGSRFPRWRPTDRGSLVGLSPDDGPASLLRAAAEGAAFVLRQGLAVLEAAGLAVDDLVVVGGAAHHAGLLQLRADVLGRPLRIAANAEASGIGAAMTAGLAAGLFADAGEAAAAMVRDAGVIRPDAGRARLYAEKFRLWSASLGLDGPPGAEATPVRS